MKIFSAPTDSMGPTIPKARSVLCMHQFPLRALGLMSMGCPTLRASSGVAPPQKHYLEALLAGKNPCTHYSRRVAALKTAREQVFSSGVSRRSRRGWKAKDFSSTLCPSERKKGGKERVQRERETLYSTRSLSLIWDTRYSL